jgi:hypothetical protein
MTTTLRTVREITTPDLTVGDTITQSGVRRQVIALEDTGRPAVFGTGTEWAIRLQDETTGRRIDLAAATSQRWTRA